MQYTQVLPLFVFFLLPRSSVFAAAEKPQTLPEAPANPQALVREVVQNGLRYAHNNQIHWAFREILQKDGRRETHEVCQTSAGTIDRLVAINGQPLSTEQQRREDLRLRNLLANGGEIHKERQKERQDAAKQSQMFANFPDAFRYKYAGTEGGLVKLTFEPDPRFVPDTRQEEVFHHLEGTMWIDPEQKQLARVDGELTSEVKFAGGLLGHLDKGGIFSVKFSEVDPGYWVMVALHVDMNGKALLFKTIAVQEQREFDDYRRVPNDLSLQQGTDLLEKLATLPSQSAANSPRQK